MSVRVEQLELSAGDSKCLPGTGLGRRADARFESRGVENPARGLPRKCTRSGSVWRKWDPTETDP